MEYVILCLFVVALVTLTFIIRLRCDAKALQVSQIADVKFIINVIYAR